MNKKTLDVISAITSIATVGVTLLSAWVSNKKTDTLIAEKVAEGIAKLNEKK